MINLTKDIQHFYGKCYKFLLKDIKENLNRESYHVIGKRLNVLASPNWLMIDSKQF